MYVRGKGNEALNGYLPPFYGGAYPADTWTAVMELLMEGVEEESFPEPAFVDGEAPSDGHAPYTPPPPPPEKKKQKPKPPPPETPTGDRPPRRRRRCRRPGDGDPGRGGGGQGGPPACEPTDPTARDRCAHPRGPVRAQDERGGRRAGGTARPAAPVVGAGARAAGAVRVWSSLSRLVQHQPCMETNWADDKARYAKMCYSDVPYLYTGRGYAEGPLALRRLRRPVRGDRVPRRHLLPRLGARRS